MQTAVFSERDFASCGLDLYFKRHGGYGSVGLIVHGQVAGEGLSELNCAKRGRQGEEMAGMGEVSEGLWVARERL